MQNTTPRPFRAVVWVSETPGQRVEVLACSPDEAREVLIQRYGSSAIISVWNEEDAASPRLAEGNPG